MKKITLLTLLFCAVNISFAQLKFTIYGESPTATEITIVASGAATTTNSNTTGWYSYANLGYLAGNPLNGSLSAIPNSSNNPIILSDGENSITLNKGAILFYESDYLLFFNSQTSLEILANTLYTLEGSQTYTLGDSYTFGDFNPGTYYLDSENTSAFFNRNWASSDVIVEIIMGPAPSVPEVTTTNATNITDTSADIAGNITASDSSVTERGIIYATTSSNLKIGETGVIKNTNGTGTGVFSETISGLTADTTYYYRAYAINSDGNGYGTIKSFKTLGASIASIEREDPTLESTLENTLTYKVTFNKPVKDVDTSDFTTNSVSGTISNVNQISSTVYEVTIDNIATFDDIYLQIKGVDGVAGSNNITTLAVASNPNIILTQNTSDDHLGQGKVGQTYTAGINGLLKKVTFYPRDGNHTFTGTADLTIYSGDETDGGTEIHSESINITNSTAATGQEFTLSSIVNITQGSTYSVVLNNFSGSGSYAFYNNTTNVYAGGHVIFTGMNDSSHLNFDLKIKIEEGTIGYIGDLILSTASPSTNEKYIKLRPSTLPTIETGNATNITSSSATLAGTISQQGASEITERGIVYATTDSYPKIGETGVTKVVSAQSTTTFSDDINITGLNTAKVFFYRAYATNSNGTGYGEVKKFSLNNALHFDGNNDHFTVDDNPNLDFSNGITIDALVNIQLSGSSQSFISKYANDKIEFSILVTTDGNIEFFVSNTGSSSNRGRLLTTSTIESGTWYHIACTYQNNGTTKAYINGVNAGGGVINNPSGPLFASDAPLELGARDSNYDFNGTLDEVRIWNKPLSESQINQIKFKPVPYNADGLVTYYQFNQGVAEGDNSSITQLFNTKTNALEGSITGFSNTGTTSNFVAGVSGDFDNNTVAKNMFMATGNWSNASNWSFNKVPTKVESAFIAENQTVTIDVDDVEIDDFELENNATLNIPTDKEIIVNNSFVSNGNLTLSSDKTNSGVLLINGTTSGNVTYTRGGLVANEWSIVTPPVSGQTIKTFAENNANDIRNNTTVSPIRYAIGYYDDSQTTGNKWQYYTADVNASTTFTAGSSYAISRATNGSVSFTGTLQTDNLNLFKSLSEDTWVAIGNPFTTYFPANKNSGNSFLEDNLSKLDTNFQSLYVWDDTQDKYVAVTQIDAANRSLPPGQGFFIRMKAGETEVNFDATKRSTKPATGTTDFSKGGTTPDITLHLKKDKTDVTTSIKFFENATTGFDAGYDIGNFDSSSLDIYSHLVDNSNTKNYTIQSLSNANYDGVIIPISVNAKQGDALSFSGAITNLPTEINVYLEDKTQNTFTLLNGNDTKQIVAENDGTIKDRFYLHLSQKVLSTTSNSIFEVSMYANNNNNNRLFVNGLQNEGTLKVYSILGKAVLTKKVKATSTLEVNLPNLNTGVYIAKIITEKGNISKKIIIK